MAGTSKKSGKNCRIVMCLEAKGLGFCYECSEYPDCEKFRETADSCLKDGENLIENLNKIRAGEVDKWLEQEDEKWRCQKCGKPVAMQLTECHWCGTKLHVK